MKKKNNFLVHVVCFFVIVAMLMPTISPVNAYAAEDLYLAYQNDEYGTAVVKLKSAAREAYRVDELCMNVGEQVDLCFINATSWTNAQWTSSDNSVVKVSSAGVVTAVAPGVAQVTLTYSKWWGTKVSATATFYVGEENWGLALVAEDILPSDTNGMQNTYEMNVEESLTLHLIGRRDSGGMYTTYLESSNIEVAEVNGNVVTAKKTGTATVTMNITNEVTKYTLRKQVNICVKKTVTEKMDELFELVGDKYFTVTQKACKNSWESGHECENCKVSNVIKAGWFTETLKHFGAVNYSNFPQQHYNTTGTNYNGHSCFGFTLFAQYYVYATDNTQKLVLEEPIYGTFTKEFAKTYLQPGDVIRLNNAHSALVYSVEEDGVIIIDSNGWKSDLNCCVRKKKMSYTGSIYAGKSIIVDRVANSTILPGSANSSSQIQVSGNSLSKTDVRDLQYNLNFLGYNCGSADGEFGNATKNAVSNLQSALHMDATGKADIEFCTMLKETVSNIQSYMNQKGYQSGTVDGVGGNLTKTALKKVQKENGYSQTGTADIATLKAILKDVSVKLDLSALNDYVAKMEGTYGEKTITPTVTPIPTLIQRVSSVQDKLDYLLNRLGAADGNTAYFTKNQKSCNTSFVPGHGCDENCLNTDVVKEKWFKEIFGYVDAGKFPSHTISTTGERNHVGYSCFGFACFAQWYLYADGYSENIKGQEVKAAKFNKDNMMAYAQPGDVIRVNEHSVVVYSVEADGLWVVDCNWNTSVTGEKLKNCVVQKHFFSYSDAIYAGKMAYINRVEKVINGGNQIGQFDIDNLSTTQIPVLKTGERNKGVQYFQQNLYYLGYTVGTLDGDYGNKTSTAVKNLQNDLNLEQTGEVNMYLYHLVNDAMQDIQQYLIEKGYYSLEVDGIAGPGTSKAIAKLQTEWKMNATGRVTLELMQKIVEQKGASSVQNLANYVNALE